MKPILFDRGQFYFGSVVHSSGYGLLDECIRCEVTEEINGIYECSFDYPMTGQHFSRLVSGGYCIAIIHDHNGDLQLFDIYRYEANIEGIVTFYASHVSYRLVNQICGRLNPIYSYEDVLYWAIRYCVDGYLIDGAQGTFRFVGDPTELSEQISPFYYPERWNVREMLFGSDLGTVMYYGTDEHEVQSVLQRFGGEFVFNNFDINYHKKRGKNNGVQIIYGKNLTAIDRNYDSGSIVSRVYPIWRDGNGVVFTYPSQTSPNFTIHKYDWLMADDPLSINYFIPMTNENNVPLEFRVPDIRSAIYDMTELFESQPSDAQARQAALNYMSKNSTWRPDDSISVDFIDLYASPDYANIKDLEKCALGDYVSVYYAELGVVVEDVEIVSATFDVIAERFTQMELNSMRSTLAEVIIDAVGGKK